MNQIKKNANGLIKQWYAVWKDLLIYVYIPSIGILLVALISILVNPSISADRIFRDITTLAGLPFYTGVVSQLGALLWAATVTSCFLSLSFMRWMKADSAQSRRFLLHSGLLSAMLLFDDMFLFHDEIAYIYLSIGQGKIYLMYFLIILAFLYFNHREILSSKYLFLFLAMMTLGLSMFLDILMDKLFAPVDGSFFDIYGVFFEDGLKFIGISTWLAFHLHYIKDIFTPFFERDSSLKHRKSQAG